MLQAPRLHLGFKPCQRNSNRPTTGQYATANQTSYEDKDNKASGKVGDFIQNLNSNQYHQLMSMFSNHLASTVKFSEHQDVPTTSYSAADSQLMGTFFLIIS